MKNSYKHYPAVFVMRSLDPSTLRITDIWKFKSTKSNKWYIVEMEHFDNNLIAVKFYYKGVRWSEHRYSLMTNDYEPRTIVYSCLWLMVKYYLKDNTLSFGFVAAEDFDSNKNLKHGNRRFRFYSKVVRYFFGVSTFIHVVDKDERLYLLLNREQLRNGGISLGIISDAINRLFEDEFHLSWD